MSRMRVRTAKDPVTPNRLLKFDDEKGDEKGARFGIIPAALKTPTLLGLCWQPDCHPAQYAVARGV